MLSDANPYPAVQRGGMRAVAMATPGITVDVRSFLDCATMPAKPPAVATSTSHTVGEVRARISLWAVDRGDKKK